jgi:hypothetical protein
LFTPECSDGFENNFDIYRQLIYRKAGVEIDFEFMKKICRFSYKKNDEKSMLDSMRYALGITNQLLLHEISKVTDLDSCIKYYYIFNDAKVNMLFAFDDYTGEPILKARECFILIKANDKDDGIWNLYENCEAYAKQLRRGNKPLIMRNIRRNMMNLMNLD